MIAYLAGPRPGGGGAYVAPGTIEEGEVTAKTTRINTYLSIELCNHMYTQLIHVFSASLIYEILCKAKQEEAGDLIHFSFSFSLCVSVCTH